MNKVILKEIPSYLKEIVNVLETLEFEIISNFEIDTDEKIKLLGEMLDKYNSIEPNGIEETQSKSIITGMILSAISTYENKLSTFNNVLEVFEKGLTTYGVTIEVDDDAYDVNEFRLNLSTAYSGIAIINDAIVNNEIDKVFVEENGETSYSEKYQDLFTEYVDEIENKFFIIN